MNILALQGSPRSNGNTQAVLDIALAAAQEAGANVDTIHLAKLDKLTGCAECFACQQSSDEPGCAIDDDMQGIVLKAIKADVLVWATPVFCWSPAWPIKIAMDRFYCVFKFDEAGDYRCLLEGRKMAAVITAGGGDDDGADLVTETCRRMTGFTRCDWLGALVASQVTDPEAIRADADLVERARAFGRTLAS
jgi:multimeric flavodoxin WrbA